VQSKFISKSYRGISNDIRVCLEKIIDCFPTPPWDNARVSLNKGIIEKFLAGPIEFSEVDPKRGLKLAAVVGELDRQRIAPVFFGIYYIQGKILWAQYKTSNQVKSHRGSGIVFK
jgi:hypothetical protein